MSEMRHERPGVYSVYDASSVTSAGRAAKRIGVAALSVKGTANTAVTLTGYGAGVEIFGEDLADTPGMSTLLKLLFANGASTVYAVRVGAGGGLEAYQAAFAALANCDVQVVVCDSGELTIQKALKTAVETASAARGERIGVIGGSGDTAAQLVTRAEAINSERMVLVGPDMKDESGKALSGVFAAAAVAGAIACGADPAVPLNGAELYGIGGLQSVYSDNDIDLLVQGGVTPLEDVGGVVSPVRGITTRTKTGSAADSTWRELTTVLIADDVIPAVRSALRSKFARAKNTAQGRGAIRAQTIVELEKKKDAQIIESYGEVAVTASADDPTVCLVEFSFAVAHGLNQIHLAVHLTVLGGTDMKGFTTSADIYLELDGRKIAVVQSYKAKAAKSSKNIEAFGESEPVATIEGQKSYTVELTRLYATDTAISDGIDFYSLTDFSLVICKPDRKVIYSGCEWSGIQEEGELNATVAEKVTLTAARRIETTA